MQTTAAKSDQPRETHACHQGFLPPQKTAGNDNVAGKDHDRCLRRRQCLAAKRAKQHLISQEEDKG